MIAGGRIYLRDEQPLFCYDVRGEAGVEARSATKTVKIDLTTSATVGDSSEKAKTRTLRSVFVPTPQDFVEKMQEMAAVKKTDVVYDLGSGDGRIVITAAKKYGCKTVGYELDKDLVEQSRTKADAVGGQAARDV